MELSLIKGCVREHLSQLLSQAVAEERMHRLSAYKQEKCVFHVAERLNVGTFFLERGFLLVHK